MLDTLYKTDNAKCSQWLLKYRNDSLESIVHGVCRVLVYIVTTYAMTSFVQVQPVWGQHSEGEDLEALSLSSPLCAAPVDLLNPSHLQVLHGLVQLAKMGCNWFFCFLCSYVRAISVHPDMEGVLCFSDMP